MNVPTTAPSADTFRERLAPIRRGWMLGTGVAGLLRWLAVALAALLAYAVLDAVFAFPSVLRSIFGILFLVGVIVLALAYAFSGVRRLGSSAAAAEADRQSADPRRPVLTALELSDEREGDAATELGVFLREQAIGAGSASLEAPGAGQVFPKAAVIRAALILAVPVMVLAVTASVAPRFTRTLASRIFTPGADVPPYSPLQFAVSPARHRVIYGDPLPISAKVTGGKVKEAVELVVRSEGGTEAVLQTFRKGEDVYAQQLENVVAAGELCFRTGRARSAWYPLEVLYEPRIRGASVTLTPPRYSGLAPETFDAGGAPLAALRGTTIRLEVSSNRPLASGTLALKPTDGLTAESVIVGTRHGENSVAFEWELASGAALEISVTDLLGTGSPEPLVLAQEVVVDAPPAVEISQPSGLVYATPEVAIPVSGYAEDDLALRRVELARGLAGFRDRVRTLPASFASSNGKRVRFEEVLDMKTVGTAPGQTVELYLEATDQNPALTGVAASDPVRIEVITEERYAAMLRERTTLEEFMARYAAVAAELAAARETLTTLASTPNDAAAKDAAIAQLEKTAELLEKIAEDFPAYDLEKSLAEMAEKQAAELTETAEALAAATGAAELERAIAAGQERLGAAQNEAEGAKEKASEVAAVAQLMKQAAAFRQTYEQQQNLARRLERFAKGEEANDAGRLGYYQQEQEKLKEELGDVLEKIGEAAAALPAGYSEMTRSAGAFVAEARGLRITDAMDEAAKAAGNGDGRGTYTRATLAKERMEQLLDDPQDGACKQFAEMCRGQQTFDVSPDVGATLSQMLGSLFRQGGSGTQPGGSGVGGTGSTNDGSFFGASTPLNIPMFGPDRMSFGTSGSGRAIARPGGGGPGSPSASDAPDAAEIFSPTDRDRAPTGNVAAEEVPQKYRDALRRYFLPDPEPTP